MSENYRPGRSNNLATKKYVDNHLGYKIRHGVKDDVYKNYDTVSTGGNDIGVCEIIIRSSIDVLKEVEITLIHGESLTAPKTLTASYVGDCALLYDENADIGAAIIKNRISYDSLTPEMFGDSPFIAEIYDAGNNSWAGRLYTLDPGSYGVRIVMTGMHIELSEDFVAAVKAISGREEGGVAPR